MPLEAVGREVFSFLLLLGMDERLFQKCLKLA